MKANGTAGRTILLVIKTLKRLCHLLSTSLHLCNYMKGIKSHWTTQNNTTRDRKHETNDPKWSNENLTRHEIMKPRRDTETPEEQLTAGRVSGSHFIHNFMKVVIVWRCSVTSVRINNTSSDLCLSPTHLICKPAHLQFKPRLSECWLWCPVRGAHIKKWNVTTKIISKKQKWDKTWNVTMRRELFGCCRSHDRHRRSNEVLIDRSEVGSHLS